MSGKGPTAGVCKGQPLGAPAPTPPPTHPPPASSSKKEADWLVGVSAITLASCTRPGQFYFFTLTARGLLKTGQLLAVGPREEASEEASEV